MLFLADFTWSQNEDLGFPDDDIKSLSPLSLSVGKKQRGKKKKKVPYLGRESLDRS